LCEVLADFDLLLADPSTTWQFFCEALIKPKPCEILWESIALVVLVRGNGRDDWLGDVVVGGQFALAVQFEKKENLHAWLAAARPRFERWLRAMIRNRCRESLRARRLEELEMRPQGKLKRCAMPKDDSRNQDDEDASPADQRMDEQARADSICARASALRADSRIDLPDLLAAFPERTRMVLDLRMKGHTWAEAASELGISIDQARWSIESRADELQRVFAGYRPGP
jgi:DNA-directed RNA polymerase specialized sigma24 family protein